MDYTNSNMVFRFTSAVKTGNFDEILETVLNLKQMFGLDPRTLFQLNCFKSSQRVLAESYGTAIHSLCEANHRDIAGILAQIKHVFDPRMDTTDQVGNTPAHWAAFRGDVRTLRALHTIGAPIHGILNDRGHTPVLIATRFPKALELFLQLYPDVLRQKLIEFPHKIYHGPLTLLHLCTVLCLEESARLCVQYDRWAIDTYGPQLLDLSCQAQCPGLVRFYSQESGIQLEEAPVERTTDKEYIKSCLQAKQEKKICSELQVASR